MVLRPACRVQTQEAPGPSPVLAESACQADVNTPWGTPAPAFLGRSPDSGRKPPAASPALTVPPTAFRRRRAGQQYSKVDASLPGNTPRHGQNDCPAGCWEDGGCSALAAEAAGHQRALGPRGCSFSFVGTVRSTQQCGKPSAPPQGVDVCLSLAVCPALPAVPWSPEALAHFSVTSSDRKASHCPPELLWAQDWPCGLRWRCRAPGTSIGRAQHSDCPASVSSHLPWCKSCVSLSPEQNVNRCRTAEGVSLPHPQGFVFTRTCLEELSNWGTSWV